MIKTGQEIKNKQVIVILKTGKLLIVPCNPCIFVGAKYPRYTYMSYNFIIRLYSVVSIVSYQVIVGALKN